MTSATISAVGQYLMITLPAFCALRTKWYRTSICFDLRWLTGFLDKAIVPWLSSKNQNRATYLTNVFHHLSEIYTFLDCCCQSDILSFT